MKMDETLPTPFNDKSLDESLNAANENGLNIEDDIEQIQEEHDMDEDSNEADDIIILHMDVRDPLQKLQQLAEEKICVDLSGYTFWLQDTQELESHKNLVDQCVKAEGLVQINVQIQTDTERINIVDVLKPTEAALAALSFEEYVETEEASVINTDIHSEASKDSIAETDKRVGSKKKPALNWLPDAKFRKEQAKHKIPEDPLEWNQQHVQFWLNWAQQQFHMNLEPTEWNMTGEQLCSLTHEEFLKKVKEDPGNTFWTHIQLIKSCKFVAVIHEEAEAGKLSQPAMNKEFKIMRKTTKSYSPVQANSSTSKTNGAETSNSSLLVPTGNSNSGNNGQVQLWQFLLDILTDREHVHIIQWVGKEGEFKLVDPERVARLWGERKNKPAMNYEKLSRALRYYYDGDMISKVNGKRFAYKFDCDLKLLIGYDAGELSELVNKQPNNYDEANLLEQVLTTDLNSDEE